jgi:hypothetical protein
VHIQLNEATHEAQVINNGPDPLAGAVVHVTMYNLDGSLASERDMPVNAPPSSATTLGPVELPAGISAVHFIKLELKDAGGRLISSNFYWQALPEQPDDLANLGDMPTVTLDAKVEHKGPLGDAGANMGLLVVTLHNPTTHVALMAHLQLRRAHSGERVLPVYYSDNYVSLVPNETRTITIEADKESFSGEAALVVVDGWNVTVAPASAPGGSIAPNVDAQPDHWPVTGLPFQTTGLRQ